MREEAGHTADVTSRLVARLRREAAAERPEFSPERHARLLARVVPGRFSTPRRFTLPAIAGGLAAAVVVVLAVLVAWRAPERPAADAPGIERFPTLSELQEGMAASVTAALVDLPPWVDLVMVEPAEVP